MKTVNNRYTVKGFTLLELMIVVAIIGIIAAIAYPSYMNSVRKSNRADAKAALSDAAQQMQRCYTLNNTFVDCDDNLATTSPEEFYTIAASGVSASAYTLTATAAKAPQTEDVGACQSLTLNHLGEKTPNPDTDTNRCW